MHAGDKRPASSRLVYLLKVLGAGGAFLCLLYFSDTRALKAAFRGADYWLVGLGSAVFLYGQFLAAQRWRGVLLYGAVSVSPLGALRLNLIGTFVGNFLPGQGSGDLVKSAFLFSAYPERKLFLLASVVYDRVLGLTAMACLALIGVLVLGVGRGDWSLGGLAGGMAAGALVAVGGFWWIRRRRPGFGPPMAWLGSRFARFSGQFVELLQDRRLLLRSFLLSMLFQVSWALSLWFMLCAVFPAAPLTPVLLAAPLAVLIATVPVSLGGLGVREGAFSFLMQRFGMEADVATAGALLALAPLLVASFAGAILAFLQRYGRGVSSDGAI